MGSHFGVGAPPILEPILVGIGMFTGGTRSLTHGHLKQRMARHASFWNGSNYTFGRLGPEIRTGSATDTRGSEGNEGYRCLLLGRIWVETSSLNEANTCPLMLGASAASQKLSQLAQSMEHDSRFSVLPPSEFVASPCPHTHTIRA